MSTEEQEPRIIVDEDWKSRVEEEKRKAAEAQEQKAKASASDARATAAESSESTTSGSADVNSVPLGGSQPVDSTAEETQSGHVQSDRVQSEQAQSEQAQSERTQSERTQSERTQSRHAPQLPPATFDSLVETLSMQAMASLNEAMQTSMSSEPAPSEPASGSRAGSDNSAESPSGIPDPRFHLSMAKYLIDTLSVLQEKTKGNLSSDEDQRLEKVLHDLRMGFIAVSRQVG